LAAVMAVCDLCGGLHEWPSAKVQSNTERRRLGIGLSADVERRDSLPQ
jgi:hypothetical protein